MFRDHVGDVTYVELFSDENDKPRGCGILEFGTKELAMKAVDKMHRFDLKGRKLVVKEDFDVERDKTGRIVKGSGMGGGGKIILYFWVKFDKKKSLKGTRFIKELANHFKSIKVVYVTFDKFTFLSF
jgi:RNA recognition motif-containing protein